MEEEEMKTTVRHNDGNEKLRIQNPNDERRPWWRKWEWECLGEKKISGGAKEEHKKGFSRNDIGSIVYLTNLIVHIRPVLLATDLICKYYIG